MTDKIVELNFKPEPEQVVIDVLEKWLALAKEGKVTGVAVAGTLLDNAQSTEFAHDRNSKLRLNSAIATLFVRYGNYILES